MGVGIGRKLFSEFDTANTEELRSKKEGIKVTDVS